MEIKVLKVEKEKFYSVADILIEIEQRSEKKGTSTHLVSKYRVAYTSEHSLSEFIRTLRSEPIKYYKNQFCKHSPIQVVIEIKTVTPDEYRIDKMPTSGSLFILRCVTNLYVHELMRTNINLIGYRTNIE